MSDRILVAQKQIESKIYSIRGAYVMLDSDLASLYNTTTGRLNEQVKRNMDRFPDDFMFHITGEEWEHLKSQNAISNDSSSSTSKYAILNIFEYYLNPKAAA